MIMGTESSKNKQPMNIDIQKLLKNSPYFLNSENHSIEQIIECSELVRVRQGQTLSRYGVLEESTFLLVDGSVRLLAKDTHDKLYTVGKATAGDLLGVVDVIRQEPCEAAIARQESLLLKIKTKVIAELILKDEGLARSICKTKSSCEEAKVLTKVYSRMEKPPLDEQSWIKAQIQNKDVNQTEVMLLSSLIEGEEEMIGRELTEKATEELKKKSKLPIRFISWRKTSNKNINSQHKAQESEQRKELINKDTGKQLNDEFDLGKTLDYVQIGVKEVNERDNYNNFKLIKGKGRIDANLATLRMIGSFYNTPCPVDVIEKVLEGAVERGGSIPIQGMGQLAESMGLQTQTGEVPVAKLKEVEFPVLFQKDGYFSLITNADGQKVKIADPERGWVEIDYEEIVKTYGMTLKVVLLKKLGDTPQKQFGWSWFTPVIKRFKWPLTQVLLASLFIQLFQLANPLLIQQIIDKVINQSNLSALQVLGAALVASALFQGLLTAVRTWLLIDTTDRMDLVLGSQVIDKLLRLPLRFFEKRPVGELSQRLSELGNLRNFLTGTGITSALDLLFATIYIFIMGLYSPLLTVVALSTIPVYVAMILGIAPLYRKLIRKRAQFAARTQSHLIETLGGIQTVKAQHFELNSRWRWQERYSGQIAEGFKSVVIGSTASEIGNFLNQLSSLLIIWIGVYQVVDGNLSLGQLIAFRIIAGYVTGPILRLSSLWQGFQQAGISMERLADIVDQIPETGEEEHEQIALPALEGNIVFDRLTFRFGNQGPPQVKEVSLEVGRGDFVGIVGQSGSGKSTLMKLLPRLYEPESGRILIDKYDISKVSLSSVRQQIGIVPQDCLLFEGTIRENIAMNHPEADTESIVNVAKAAVAHEFIMELPEGYATRLGERGAGLSGGQRQRIAVARTLLQNPNLLILDEATSALDYDTEAQVCQNLQNILTNKTVFFITHRLSTVKNADLIIMMHQGEIVEKGSHKELMALGGRYAALYAHQGDA